MTVTIYRSTDTGAPVLPANSNYVKASFFMDIIKQCLVTGYGSKPGAGWTLSYEDTTANKRRLAVSNANGVMEFITWGVTGIAMIMWDSITTPGNGRFFDDSFSSVMSTGLNGWKSQLVAAPGQQSDNIFGINLASVHNGNSTSIGWTVFADDKSVWILFHYPIGNSNASGSSSLSTSTTLHPQVFFGAVKSPDLGRNQLGNFFAILPVRAAGTLSVPGNSGNNSLTHYWGLRTPQNTLPVPANSSAYTLSYWNDSGANTANPHSSVRVLIPAAISYLGIDVVKPGQLTESNGHYIFATVPGLAQFSSPNAASTASNYWGYLNVERGATWNLQFYTVNGVDWMPWSLSGGNSSLSNYGITNDASWWS